MELIYLTDATRMMTAEASALSVLTMLALGTFIAGIHLPSWKITVVGLLLALRGAGHRAAGTLRDVPVADRPRRHGRHRPGVVGLDRRLRGAVPPVRLTPDPIFDPRDPTMPPRDPLADPRL